MRRFLFVMTIFLALVTAKAFPVEAFFTPSRDCESVIIGALEKAKDIVIAVYSISNPRIVAALKMAKGRGANLRILTHSLQASSRSSKIMELLTYGLNLRVNSHHKIMHNKFATFDDKVAISGSYNWTTPASEQNDENCLLIDEPKVVSAYKKNFENLWNLNAKENSDRKLSQIKETQKRK